MASNDLTPVRFELTGVVPLVMHNNTTVNPFNPLTQAIKAITDKRKKTDDDIKEMYKLEWEAGLYHHPVIGPYIPLYNIKATLCNAGAITRDKQNVLRGLLMTGEDPPLVYRGPRDKDGLWADGNFNFTTAVKLNGRTSVTRCRPIFPQWALECTALLDQSVLDLSALESITERAGIMIGLCDYRPRYGRFDGKVFAA